MTSPSADSSRAASSSAAARFREDPPELEPARNRSPSSPIFGIAAVAGVTSTHAACASLLLRRLGKDSSAACLVSSKTCRNIFSSSLARAMSSRLARFFSSLASFSAAFVSALIAFFVSLATRSASSVSGDFDLRGGPNTRVHEDVRRCFGRVSAGSSAEERASSVTSSVSSDDFFVREGALGLGGGVCSSSSSRTTSMGSPTPSSRRLRTGDVHFMLQLHDLE